MGGGGGGMGGGGGGIGGEDIGQGSSSSYENSGIEQEQMLVDKILAPGGVRVAPPKEELNKFISRYGDIIRHICVWFHFPFQVGFVILSVRLKGRGHV